MKMRKILPLVILAVGSLFLLSSCDAMLDAIFSSNQVIVDVAVSSTGSYSDWYFGTNPQVTCYIYGSSGLVGSTTAGWSSWDGYFLHFNFPFRKLKDDTYTFYASYSGLYGGNRGPDGYLYDGNYGSTVFAIVATTPYLTMPYANSSDSTGHSMNVRLYIP